MESFAPDILRVRNGNVRTYLGNKVLSEHKVKPPSSKWLRQPGRKISVPKKVCTENFISLQLIYYPIFFLNRERDRTRECDLKIKKFFEVKSLLRHRPWGSRPVSALANKHTTNCKRYGSLHICYRLMLRGRLMINTICYKQSNCVLLTMQKDKTKNNIFIHRMDINLYNFNAFYIKIR
jgi:hypothetical protein